jgi:hypothetical protein
MYETQTIMYSVFIISMYVLWLIDYIKNKKDNGK